MSRCKCFLPEGWDFEQAFMDAGMWIACEIDDGCSVTIRSRPRFKKNGKRRRNIWVASWQFRDKRQRRMRVKGAHLAEVLRELYRRVSDWRSETRGGRDLAD